MKIGVFAAVASPVATPEYLTALGRLGEERGLHSIWAPEHVVLFDDYDSSYPYSPDGKIPVAPGMGLLEPFTTLSYLAASTKTVRLGTGICLVPQRNPVYTAKEVAAVDWLSSGRLDFGVGVGWLEEEFQAVAAPFEKRGKRCREYLEVMKALWTEDRASYSGEFYELAECLQDPKPIQKPHPPIHFGGESGPALRRVADLGQGWYGFNLDPDGARERLGVLEKLLDERGRTLDEIEISICPYMLPLDLDQAKRYRDAGVDQVIAVAFASSIEELEATLDGLATSIIEPSRSL